MGLFSKNKNTNEDKSTPQKNDNLQKVALRTMQQDLAAAKKSGETATAVIIESIDSHRISSEKALDKLQQKGAAPPAPRELPRLAESEHKREGSGDNLSAGGQFNPELSSISVKSGHKPPAFAAASPQYSETFQPKEISPTAPVQTPAEIKPLSVPPAPKPKNTTPEIQPVAPESAKNKRIKLPSINFDAKKIIPAAIATIIIITAGIGAYFILNQKSPAPQPNLIGNPLEEPVQNPQIIENEFKLLEFADTYNLDIDFDTLNKFDGSVKAILAENISSKELEIPAKGFLDIQISINGEFPASSQIVNASIKEFSEPVLSAVSEKYNLAVYMQESSPRIGLVLEITDKSTVSSLLKDQEDNLAESLVSFYFDSSKIGSPSSEKFNETIYKGAIVRYKNFPVHTSAIDYAILDNFLIISTSKDSMFELIDIITELRKTDAES